jgi:HAD superfamily hydrolase (TIGR01509 family)
MPTPLIFDCDGVIVDSEAISMSIDAMLMQRHGIEITEEEMHKRFVGSTFAAMMRDFATKYGVEFPPDLEQIKDAEMEIAYRSGLPEIPGIKPSLFTLRARGHRMAIASNGPRHRIHLALGILGLENIFDEIVTFEDVVNPKPAPDMYLLAASKLGAEAKDCIVLEDSVTGLTAAVASGARVIGVTATHPHPNEHAEALRLRGASAIIHDLGDLPKLIAG